jgi:outer membrane protein TolC
MVPFQQKWTSVGSASVTQAIFDQAVFTGLKAAKTTREFYTINQQLTEEQLIEAVSINYLQIYVFKQKLNFVESNLKSTQKVRDIIKGQYDNGLAKKIDYNRISVKVSNLEANRQQFVKQLELQENTLKFFIGMPMTEKISIPKLNFELSADAFTEEVTIDNRSEIQLLKKQEQLLGLQKKYFQAEYYPTLSLDGSYGYQGLGKEFPLGATPQDQVYWSNFATVGLSMRIPVFNGFATRSRVRMAEVDLKKISEDIKETELALNYDFENAKTQMTNSIINVRSQKDNVALAKEVMENTNNNYLNGLATLTDLLDSETALNEAQNAYTIAQYEYKLAEIQIIKSKGELKSLLK